VPSVFDAPNLILVEGTDEQGFLVSLLEEIEGPDTIIHQMNGKDKWRAKLAAIVEEPTFTGNVRGLVLLKDADSDSGAAAQSCRDALEAAGLPTPADAGQVAIADGLRVGVYVLPGDRAVGTLEDLVLRAGTTSRLEASDQFLGDLSERGHPPPRSPTKAKLQSYLAGELESPRNLAVGMAQGVFQPTAECFVALREFLEQVLLPAEA
jgi:hypothetical protein